MSRRKFPSVPNRERGERVKKEQERGTRFPMKQRIKKMLVYCSSGQEGGKVERKTKITRSFCAELAKKWRGSTENLFVFKIYAESTQSKCFQHLH